MEKVLVTVLGLSTSPSALGTFALILTETGGKRRLPIIIGSSEAQSIALEIEKIKPPRPLTHDLIKNMFEIFGATVSEVVIDDLKDGVFYAKIYVEINGEKTAIDSRPSDAIALAVRTQAEIYVSELIMQEAAIEPGEEENQEGKSEVGDDTNVPISKPASSKPLDKINQLENDLQQAILKEDYEKAAKIRDEINRLKS